MGIHSAEHGKGEAGRFPTAIVCLHDIASWMTLHIQRPVTLVTARQTCVKTKVDKNCSVMHKIARGQKIGNAIVPVL